jgi:hypothetical protein
MLKMEADTRGADARGVLKMETDTRRRLTQNGS